MGYLKMAVFSCKNRAFLTTLNLLSFYTILFVLETGVSFDEFGTTKLTVHKKSMQKILSSYIIN